MACTAHSTANGTHSAHHCCLLATYYFLRSSYCVLLAAYDLLLAVYCLPLTPPQGCVYIGHAAFKAMGCRVGYLYLNMAPTAYFGLMQGTSALRRVVPIETGVGFLLWVGLQITASGFEGDQTPEGWKHGPAVAMGLLPSISAWGWQGVSTTYRATRTMFCEGAPTSKHTCVCSQESVCVVREQ